MSSSLFVLAWSLRLAAPIPAQEPAPPSAAPAAPAAQAFVEVTASKVEPFVGESIDLLLRFGFEPELLDGHLVALFARDFDLPVQVEWSAAREVAGLKFRAAPAAAEPGVSCALDEEVARARRGADVVRDGRTFRTFELVRRATAIREGAAHVPEPALRFAHASRIEDDLIRGKVPVDRRVFRVAGAPLALRVRPLPEAGRPAEFTGAVGRRKLAASAEPTELRAGESVRLSLAIEGEGDPTAFGAPDLSRLPGFVLRGVLDGHDETVRRLVYDLSPQDERVAAIPSLGFAWFSSEEPVGYVVERTAPIALTVAPGPPRGDAAAPTPPARPWRRSSSRHLPIVAAVVAIVIALAAARRRSAQRAAAALADPRANAAVRFRARLEEPGADPGDAFADYLAVRLGVAPAAVVAPDLAARLERSGVPRDLAAEVAARLASRIAARYAGGAAAAPAERTGEAAELARLVERLEPLELGPPPGAAGAKPPR